MSTVDDLALAISELREIFQDAAGTVSGPAAQPFQSMVSEVATGLSDAEIQLFTYGRPMAASEIARQAIIDALYAAEGDILKAAKGDRSIIEAWSKLEEKAVVGAEKILDYSQDILISQKEALSLRQQAMNRRQRRAQQKQLSARQRHLSVN